MGGPAPALQGARQCHWHKLERCLGVSLVVVWYLWFLQLPNRPVLRLVLIYSRKKDWRWDNIALTTWKSCVTEIWIHGAK